MESPKKGRTRERAVEGEWAGRCRRAVASELSGIHTAILHSLQLTSQFSEGGKSSAESQKEVLGSPRELECSEELKTTPLHVFRLPLPSLSPVAFRRRFEQPGSRSLLPSSTSRFRSRLHAAQTLSAAFSRCSARLHELAGSARAVVSSIGELTCSSPASGRADDQYAAV